MFGGQRRGFRWAFEANPRAPEELPLILPLVVLGVTGIMAGFLVALLEKSLPALLLTVAGVLGYSAVFGALLQRRRRRLGTDDEWRWGHLRSPGSRSRPEPPGPPRR